MENKNKPEISVLAEKLLQGDRVGLSRSITIIESTHEKHKSIARELVEICLPHSGKSVRIGVTGVPGVGKSTFINAFGKFLTAKGKKVAVLAVDPSSSITKGSILGDKTRMAELSADPAAFIRPSPSSGSLGGVARATRETIILCEAAGFDVILIETVGVGQSETTVKSMVDFFLLLMITGAGDELQGIKRGIMEMADAIAITKADADNVQKAKAARAEYAHALHLFPPTESGWQPRVDICSAISGEGIENIWKTVEEYVRHTSAKGFFEKKRQEQAGYWMQEAIIENLKASFFKNEAIGKLIPEYEQKVKRGEISSYAAATELLGKFREGG